MQVITLFDGRGSRKYLTQAERRAFARAAMRMAPEMRTFLLTLVCTGARVSEVLALTPERIDDANGAIVFETLKRRKRGLYRAVPVPPALLDQLERVHGFAASRIDPERKDERLWKWGRTTAWKYSKAVMQSAGILQRLSTPKAARHAFGVDAVQNGVALNMLQRWMGHARIETTAIYADVIGREERAMARRTWTTFRNMLG